MAFEGSRREEGIETARDEAWGDLCHFRKKGGEIPTKNRLNKI